MQLHELVSELVRDNKASLWPAFAPEIVICITIMAMLIIRTIKFGEYVPGFIMALVGVGTSLYYTLPVLRGAPSLTESTEIFTGMLIYDSFTVYMRTILLIFAILFIVFTRLTKTPDPRDSVDFYCLILGATLGMCLMSSANHLLMVFMAIEIASVPSYVLAGILRNDRKASEASLKYSVFGAGAAGVMLYGISLIGGVCNTVHIPTIAVRLSENLSTMSSADQVILVLGGLMIMVGLSFKLSAVPFHFWCPDVFEGATAEVAAFLSVASKAAALALLIRVAVGVSVLPHSAALADTTESVAITSTTQAQNGFFAVADTIDPKNVSDANHKHEAESSDPLSPVRTFVGIMIAFIAAITCTFGNLAAYGQSNIKRLMGYSTIAHAGYMMLAVPAALAVATVNPESARNAVSAIALYIAIYAIMNLGAFAMISFLSKSIGSEEIREFAGLVKRAPVSVIIFSLIMFSLVGLPPLAGFLGKFAIFASLADAYRSTGSFHLIALLVVGGINTAISLFYYLRVVRVMTIDPETNATTARPANVIPIFGGAFLCLMAIPVVTLLVYLEPLSQFTKDAAQQLF